MNETEIRDRVKKALGDSSYPPDLPQRLAQHLGSQPRRDRSTIFGVVAALLALLIVGTLVFARLQSSSTPLPAAPPLPSPVAQPTPLADVMIPQYDLDQANLSASGALVTPLNLTATDTGRTVTLVGAYADSSRIVLFVRYMPDDQSFPQVKVYDDTGLLNASATGGRGIIGDKYVVLNTGPHASSDGFANMRVVVDGFTPNVRGNWTFTFALRLPASTHLRLSPPPGDVGPWNVVIETFEVTPTVVHFQAVIDGASVGDIKQNTISLRTADGKTSLQTSTYQATALAPRSTRVNVEWGRPVNGDIYFLVVNGRALGGAPINGTKTPAYIKGNPPAPTDYPRSPESITFDGAFSATISDANPTSCGVGTGPSGTMFGLAMNFQLNQAWYWIDLSTREGQYSGPGTYSVKARVLPQGGSDIFDGTVQLTVTSDRYPGPFKGSVRGTLAWTGAASQPETITIAGTWQCKPGGQLGPG